LEHLLSRRWQSRYRLVSPPAHRRRFEKYTLLCCGFIYGWALSDAIVPTAVALHLVPGLYQPVPVTSAVTLVDASKLIYRSSSVLRAAASAAGLLICAAGVFDTAGWGLGRMESWLDQGVPVCLECGYPLRGLNSPACPECGAAWSQWYPSKDGRPVLPT
jgi:hypothetical protein